MKIATSLSLVIAGSLTAAAGATAAAGQSDHSAHAAHGAHSSAPDHGAHGKSATPSTAAAREHKARSGGAAKNKAPVASATLRAPDGSTKGLALLSGSGRTWEVTLQAEGLPAGEHGAHLHAVGKCEAPDFTSAGPHLNPTTRQHGTQNPQGPHLGDLPNVTIGADGRGTLAASLAGTAAQLFDADGTAVVIHAGADDYRTDPSGNSGGRIACGVLTRGR